MIFTILLTITSLTSARAAEPRAAEDLRLKGEYLRRRIESFYRRQEERDRKDAGREAGAEDMRRLRKKTEENYEASRQRYVKNRRPKSELSAEKWELEIQKQKNDHEARRKEYIRHRESLRELTRKIGRISEEDEYDLNTQEDGEE